MILQTNEIQKIHSTDTIYITLEADILILGGPYSYIDRSVPKMLSKKTEAWYFS